MNVALMHTLRQLDLFFIFFWRIVFFVHFADIVKRLQEACGDQVHQHPGRVARENGLDRAGNESCPEIKNHQRIFMVNIVI